MFLDLGPDTAKERGTHPWFQVRGKLRSHGEPQNEDDGVQFLTLAERTLTARYYDASWHWHLCENNSLNIIRWPTGNQCKSSQIVAVLCIYCYSHAVYVQKMHKKNTKLQYSEQQT